MTILLRTLTQKSYLKFGKHADLRVGDLLSGHKKRYLRWVYFNMSMINFNDEVLEILDITEEYKIDKPGKKEGGQEVINDLMDANMHWRTKEHGKKITRILVKKKKTGINRENNSSPGWLARKNHGKNMKPRKL